MTPVRALFVSLALFVSTPAFAGGIAHVDAESILRDMPEYARARAETRAYGESLQKEIQGKQQTTMAYYQEVMEQAQSGLMSPQAQQQAEQKLMQMQQDLQQSASLAEAKLARKEQEATAPLYDKLERAMKAVAESKDYDYIVDRNMVLVARGPDATAAVRAQLGL